MLSAVGGGPVLSVVGGGPVLSAVGGGPVLSEVGSSVGCYVALLRTLSAADAPLTVRVTAMSLVVPVNSTVSLLCEASGGTPRTYSWRQDDVVLQGKTMSTLNITAAMDRNYNCTAGNGAGYFPSASVRLAVFGVCTHAPCPLSGFSLCMCSSLLVCALPSSSSCRDSQPDHSQRASGACGCGEPPGADLCGHP